MQKFILIRGHQGSGKSTFAEQGMGADFWVEEIEKTELAAVN